MADEANLLSILETNVTGLFRWHAEVVPALKRAVSAVSGYAPEHAASKNSDTHEEALQAMMTAALRAGNPQASDSSSQGGFSIGLVE